MGAEQSRTGAMVPGTANAVPHGMSTLGPNLQKRFAKGIQYNMKVVIKGDRNVGKSCLFHRLQGQAFKDEYIPTQEIQVACIQWNYKVTDDVVKVEIWDIVDKGKVKKRDGLKMDTEEADLAPTLDAEFIDVYKGTSGVIMILDITKYWTYEYVQRELKKVPLDIPVIIMASHRDMEEKRSVLTEEVQTFINELDRPSDAAAVYYMEASMKDGFGLKYLYRFFNVPFLELQRQTLLAQLRRNEEDLEAIKVELDLHSKSEEQDYERFKEYMERKRKGLPNTELQDGTAMSLRSRLSQKVLQNTPLPAKLNPTNGSGNQRIENFVPEGKLDTNFLDNSNNPSPRPSPKPQRAKINDVQISDSDDEPCGNPQVTLDQESPDEEDMVVVHKVAAPGPIQKRSNKLQPSPSSSEDDESEDEAYKPIDIMVDDDILDEPKTTTNQNVPVKRPSTSVVDTGPPPSQTIDPISPPRNCKPISAEEEEEGEEDPSSYVITPITDYVDPNEEELAEIPTSERETNSIASLEDLNLSEKISPQSTPPSQPLPEQFEPAPEAGVTDPVSTPEIDLDVLERISLAPPIAVQEVQAPKKSPKSKKKSSPKREKSPRREPSQKIEAAPKKKAPPKKSLLDIQLTSSDEDEPIATEVQTPEEPVNILQTFEEPEVQKPPPKRLNSSGSLKLAHVEPIPIIPVESPPAVAPVPKKEKKKKREKVAEKTAEEIREQRERDELDAFLGGEEVATVSREKPRKKKTKKKKSRATANNPGADDYEQF
ncbi:hypothetical protein ACHWQZ_G016232 [Mnemiopsis leidyi]